VRAHVKQARSVFDRQELEDLGTRMEDLKVRASLEIGLKAGPVSI
jgi:hypothetical protein